MKMAQDYGKSEKKAFNLIQIEKTFFKCEKEKKNQASSKEMNN